MKYYIENIGCHDETEVVIEMTEEETKAFIRVCNELNKKSVNQCQPIIKMYKITDCEFLNYEDKEPSVFPQSSKNLLVGGDD